MQEEGTEAMRATEEVSTKMQAAAGFFDDESSLSVQSPPFSGDDDIDQRAEIFISNFHHHLLAQHDLAPHILNQMGRKWSRIKTAAKKVLRQCKKKVLGQCK
ncbi:hypothetical protein QYF36_020645 [Acer negundo]|nr:hypothetical protein QYF36_020645 [Acer negundo]